MRNLSPKARWRRLVSEMRRSLTEANEDVAKEEGEDSLDSQVDKYFIEYETEAKKSKTEGLDFRMMTRSFLIEAEEEEEKDEKEKDKGEEAGEEDKEASPEKLKLEDFDMKSFVTDVMRLVDNYDSLLEVRNTILRRAVNFLSKNYEKDAPAAFKEELLESHGIEIGMSESEKQDEYQPPKAGAAGPMGGGA